MTYLLLHTSHFVIVLFRRRVNSKNNPVPDEHKNIINHGDGHQKQAHKHPSIVFDYVF